MDPKFIEFLKTAPIGDVLSGAMLRVHEEVDHEGRKTTWRTLDVRCAACAGERGCSVCDDTGSEHPEGLWVEPGGSYALTPARLMLNVETGEILVAGFITLPGSHASAPRRGRTAPLSMAYPELAALLAAASPTT